VGFGKEGVLFRGKKKSCYTTETNVKAVKLYSMFLLQEIAEQGKKNPKIKPFRCTALQCYF